MGAADIKKPVDGSELKTEQARPTSTDSSTSAEDENSVLTEKEEMDLCKAGHDQAEHVDQVDGSDLKNDVKEEKDEKKEGVNEAEDEENDGFRTPTGPEHRIPAATVCPGAPRIRRPWVLGKRKTCRARLEFQDDYLNLLFPANSDEVVSKRVRRS